MRWTGRLCSDNEIPGPNVSATKTAATGGTKYKRLDESGVRKPKNNKQKGTFMEIIYFVYSHLLKYSICNPLLGCFQP